jgi:hypothetical protein
MIEDDESGSTNAKVKDEATSDDVDTSRTQRDTSPSSTLPSQDHTSELSRPIDLSGLEQWYDVETGCYINMELPPGLEQEDSTSTPAQGCPHPLSHSQPELSDENNEGWSDDNVAELEKELQPALEEQENSSMTSASDSQHPRSPTKPTHPQIDQEHDQSGTSYGRLEELRHVSPLCSQDQEEWP